MCVKIGNAYSDITLVLTKKERMETKDPTRWKHRLVHIECLHVSKTSHSEQGFHLLGTGSGEERRCYLIGKGIFWLGFILTIEVV